MLMLITVALVNVFGRGIILIPKFGMPTDPEMKTVV
jgi:hypothetical protein